MKFRAAMQDIQYMREFQNLIITLSKLSKECVLNITKDKLIFIVNEESSTLSPLVWMEIDAPLYFTSYAMEGHNERNPSILLSMSTTNLERAFALLRNNPQSFKIKLTNVQFPCLTIESSTMAEHNRSVMHDVPVVVIPRSDWCAYKLPQIPKCMIVVNMQSNRLMRGLIDKLKNLSPNIIFYATSNGELNLVAETESATITTRYKNLEIRSCNLIANDTLNTNTNTIDTGHNTSSESTAASCSVDCKKASMFFTALQVQTSDVFCGIDDDKCIHLEVNVRNGVVIHSILPAVCI